MSWDIFVQNLPADTRDVTDIPDVFEPGPLGRRSEIIRKILEVVPRADFSDPAWGQVEGPDFSIEIAIGPQAELEHFAFHVRGGDGAAAVVADILCHLGFQALDPSSESGIFNAANAVAGFRQWRAFRDRVVLHAGAVNQTDHCD